MKKKINSRVIANWLIVVAIMSAGISCTGKHRGEKPGETVIPVQTVPVERRDMSAPVYTSGQLFPKSMIRLSFKTGGLIARFFVEEGDAVEKDQLLAVLDLSEIAPRVQQAENGYDKTRRDLERAENLHRDRAATLEQLQNARTAHDIAAADLKIARFNLQYSSIKAPAKGKILRRLAEKGEMAGAGFPVLLFGATDNNWVVKTGVSEKDIVHLKIQDPASVSFDAYPGKEFGAVVSEISSALDPASGAYEVEISLNAPDTAGVKLLAGFVGKAVIQPSARHNFYLIPIDALVEGEGSRGVLFTVKNGRAKRLVVDIAHLLPETAAIRSGLENADNVVTSGAAYLNDGSLIRIVEKNGAR